MTMGGDNGPELDGWKVQPGRHCGQICCDVACPVCGCYLPMPDAVLGEN